MTAISIFVIVEDSLYAVGYGGETDESAYQIMMNQWQDPEFLESYFEKYQDDLYNSYPGVSIESAIRKTQLDAAFFDERILEIAEKKKLGKFVFTQLHKTDDSKTYIQSKAYGQRSESWLRLYAIRLEENVYVITGGGIKLTRSMSTLELRNELENLNNVTQFLIDQNLLSASVNESGYFELRIE